MEPQEVGSVGNPDPNAGPDWAQRYAQLEQRYAESSNEGKRLAERTQALEQQIAQFAQPKTNDPYGELASLGIAEPVKSVIRKELQDLLSPLVAQQHGERAGRTRMLTQYGKEYTQFEQDVAAFVQTDDSVQKRYNTIFQSDPSEGPGAAMEYAYLAYGEHKRRTDPGTVQAETRRRVREDQGHAAVPGAARSNGQRSEEDQLQQAIHEAREAFMRMPSRENGERYAKLRFRQGSISDEFLRKGGI